LLIRPFSWVANHGKAVLVLGLFAGLLLPALATALRPWIAELVMLMLTLTAFRIGPRSTFGGFADLGATLSAALIFQLLLPVGAFFVFYLLGYDSTPIALVVVLMLSAPSVTGSPNFALLLGHDPAPALRLLLTGTALLPLTALPALALLPLGGDLVSVVLTALRLFGAICVAVAIGFTLRSTLFRALSAEGTQVLDGVTTIALAVTVIGLMSAMGPALLNDPLLVARWMAVAIVLCLGLQILSYVVLLKTPLRPHALPCSIVAGNRNVALFLLALPAATTDSLLIFLACYQFPMYLTPIVMRKIFQKPVLLP
jgi:arsenite transporter